MNVDVDPAKVLYVVGVIFGVAAVLYFARDIVFELSITVRSLLLLLAFVVLLAAALAAERTAAVLVSSVLAAATYLAFVVYSLSAFDVGTDGTFFVLLVSAALFLSLGYLVRERGLAPARQTVGYVLVGAALVAVVLIGADAFASDVDYETSLDDETELDGDGATIGTLTVDNRFVFRETIDEPNVDACVYNGTDGGVWPGPVQFRVGGDGLPDSVAGGQTIEAEMQISLYAELLATVDGPIPITEADACPDASEEAQIVVVVGQDDPSLPGPPRP